MEVWAFHSSKEWAQVLILDKKLFSSGGGVEIGTFEEGKESREEKVRDFLVEEISDYQVQRFFTQILNEKLVELLSPATLIVVRKPKAAAIPPYLVFD